MRAQFTPIKKDLLIENESRAVSQRTGNRVMSAMKKPVIIAIISIGVAVIFILFGVWIARKTSPNTAYTALPKQAASIAQLSDKQVKELVSTVSRHILLPSEMPQIVAIANVDQLKIDQPFFRSAMNEDQLLVYPSRVILYRPSTDQIVDVAQIRTNTQASPSQSSSSGKLR